ncbi:uncharacterized protein LOC111398519 [Olea europaea subsp. europaea]|uniref:Uncharacterized protein LOC111398519 n=1 Tax=Olea europaea subsp. europaea TaxID=158383 RepID=A0A8S0PTY2_OLEEU|nr:uncharacterized protein LOC111398519 [Olea europaea subsp. europaea]
MTASANLSGRFIEDNNSNGTANGATSIDGALLENAVATFHPNSSASLDWSTDEQSILEDLLSKYSSDTIIVRYAKIAQQLNDKTVRDVALRCKWMTKKGYGKRGKDDQNSLRKNKDKKEKVTASVPRSSQFANRSNGFPHTQPVLSIDNDDGISYKGRSHSLSLSLYYRERK